MEPEIGELYNTDREAFDIIARLVEIISNHLETDILFFIREWTWKFAMHDVLIYNEVLLKSDNR